MSGVLLKTSVQGKFIKICHYRQVRKHLEKALTEVSAELCVKLYDHVKKEESAYWQTDIELEALFEPEVIVESNRAFET